jgi:hypothetical protein
MRFIPQAGGESRDLRPPRIEPDPSVRPRLAERDRADDGPSDLAEALHRSPDPGGGHRQVLAPLALDQFSEPELLGAKQPSPVLHRPVANRFGVAAHAVGAGHGQRHARAMRRGHAEAVRGDLRLAVAAM